MPDAKRLLSLAAGAALIAAGAAAFLRPAPPRTILLTDVRAAPMAEEPGTLGVFLTIENSGGPDRLVDVAARGADVARIEAPEAGDGLPIPAGAAPSLAADGAWLRIEGLEDVADGRLIPLTLTFAEAGRVTAKARLDAPTRAGGAAAYGLPGIGDVCVVGEGEPAPQMTLAAEPDAEGWTVRVSAREFAFTRTEDAVHVPGEGHGHLYVDGLKLQRLYEPEARIGALPPGRHRITVTLNTNDHRAYVVDGSPVTASVVVEQD